MFVCTLFTELRSQGTTDSFYYPKKIPTQIKLPKKILAKFSYPQKIPGSTISNPKKSFDHPRYLKSRVPLPGCGTKLEFHQGGRGEEVKSKPFKRFCVNDTCKLNFLAISSQHKNCSQKPFINYHYFLEYTHTSHNA